jgi:predicted nucleotidyltransferase
VTDKSNILQLIKSTVKAKDPDAKVILFGSYARGDYNEESDIDLIILLDKDRITYDDRTRITYPLFMVEIKTGISISPLLYSKDFWETKHKVTPFYESVNEEGIVL